MADPAQITTSSESDGPQPLDAPPPSSEYIIQSVLGEGAFGQVVKCLKTATNKTVAVKIMKEADSHNAQREVEVLQHLRAFDSDRFNFLTFNNAFITGRHVCLEFEMLDMSLFDFMSQRPSRCLSVKEIRPVLHQVAITLQLLKNLGIMHTDLKPDNIMLVDHGNQPWKIKMIDFGLACDVSQWCSYMQPLYYRSPEIILGFPSTTAIDMWSLGCIAAEMFLGAVLYPGSCEYNMLRHMVQTQGHFPHHLLNTGMKTRSFFHKMWFPICWWRLKTPVEYGEDDACDIYFNSLNELTKIRPACHRSAEDAFAETEDQEFFVDLLKKMLHLDFNERISPCQLLEHPFITMSDLAERHPNNFYVELGIKMMDVCRDRTLSSEDMEHPLSLPQQLCLSVEMKSVSPEVPTTSEAQLYRGTSNRKRRGDRILENDQPQSKRRKMNDDDGFTSGGGFK